MENIRTLKQKCRGKRKKKYIASNCSQNEDTLTPKCSAENPKVLLKKYDNGKSTGRKERRKTLGDCNRLSMAGPAKTIERPLTPMPATRQFLATMFPRKCINPFSHYYAGPMGLSPPLLTPKRTPPPRHLYGCLSIKKRTPPISSCETIDITDVNDDPETIILPEKSPERKSPVANGPRSPKIKHNEQIPYVKLEKLREPIPAPRSKPIKKLNRSSLKPTISQISNSSSSKPKISQDVIYYEANFDIRKFLERSDHPREYFLSTTRKCSYSWAAFNFLLNSFRQISYSVIEKAYDLAQYNLTATADYLSRLRPGRNCGRQFRHHVKVENISQLQEIEFIRQLCDLPE